MNGGGGPEFVGRQRGDNLRDHTGAGLPDAITVAIALDKSVQALLAIGRRR